MKVREGIISIDKYILCLIIEIRFTYRGKTIMENFKN